MHCITAHKQRDLAAFFPLSSTRFPWTFPSFEAFCCCCHRLSYTRTGHLNKHAAQFAFNLCIQFVSPTLFASNFCTNLCFFSPAFCYWFWTKKRSCFVYFSNSWINIFIFCCFFNGFAFSFKVILRFIVFRCASNLNYIFWAYRTNIEWKKWAFCRLVFPSLYLMTQLYCHIEVCT